MSRTGVVSFKRITVGGIPYEVLDFLTKGEVLVSVGTIIERAKKMNVCLGENDGKHILLHQNDIPVALRGKMAFIFTDWPYPNIPGSVCFIRWNGHRWVLCWQWIGCSCWINHFRFLHRMPG